MDDDILSNELNIKITEKAFRMGRMTIIFSNDYKRGRKLRVSQMFPVIDGHHASRCPFIYNTLVYNKDLDDDKNLKGSR